MTKDSANYADKKGISVILASVIVWIILILCCKDICQVPTTKLNDNATTQANVAQITAFYCFAAMQVPRMWRFGANKDFSSQFICCLASAVCLIVGTSCLLDYIANWGGQCVDAFGVILPFTTWVEWMVCVPLLALLAIYTDRIDNISSSDAGIVILLAVTTVLGFAMSSGVSIPVYYTLFAISVAFCIYAIYLSLARRRLQPGLRNKCKVMDVSELSDVVELNCRESARSIKLSILFCTALAPFPVIYGLGAAGVLSATTAYIMLMAFNVVVKILYLNEACDAQIDVMKTVAATIASMGERANTSRRFFLRYLFHELRAPLNSVLLGLTLLSPKDTADATEREAIEMMVDSANFMADTLNDVLEMDEIEEGNMKLVQEPFSMSKMLGRARRSVAGLAAAKVVTMSLNVAENTPDILLGDRLRLQHAVVSLLEQAIKNSPEEAVVTTAVEYGVTEPDNRSRCLRTVSLSRKKPKATNDEHAKKFCISIKDSGVSMQPTELEKLFNPFQQLRPELIQQSHGTGLSLSIARDIIELHGGTLSYEVPTPQMRDFPGAPTGEMAGNVFCIDLPFDPLVSCDLPPQLEDSMMKAAWDSSCLSAGSNRIADRRAFEGQTGFDARGELAVPHNGSLPREEMPLHCLIVDDAPSNRKMLAMVLSKRDIESSMAEDGAEALQMVLARAHRHHFDMIFMDNTMPVMTGVEATAALRSPNIAYPNLIIGVTGNALGDDVTAFLAAGADMVLAKPLRPAQLRHLLAYITGHGKRSNPGFKLAIGAEGVIRTPVEPYRLSQHKDRQQVQEQQDIRLADNV